MSEKNWSEFYKAVEGKPHLKTVEIAVDFILKSYSKIENCLAIDLGCGTGRDTHYLLKNGLSVIAIDKEKEAINQLISELQSKFQSQLKAVVSSFENMELPQSNLINASFSLPFCLPQNFENTWSKIYLSLKKDGVFSGQIFGVNDEWASNDITTFSKQEIEDLFDSFSYISFEEVERHGKDAMGRPKYWHIFHIVAKKK